MSCGRPPASRCLPGVSQGDQSLHLPAQLAGRTVPGEYTPAQSQCRWQGCGLKASRRGNRGAEATPSGRNISVAGARNSGASSDGKRPQSRTREHNPEHRIGNPTLEPATELEQPSSESTSNPETAEAADIPALDADALTEPVAQAALEAAAETAKAPKTAVESAPVETAASADRGSTAAAQLQPTRN